VRQGRGEVVRTMIPAQTTCGDGLAGEGSGMGEFPEVKSFALSKKSALFTIEKG